MPQLVALLPQIGGQAKFGQVEPRAAWIPDCPDGLCRIAQYAVAQLRGNRRHRLTTGDRQSGANLRLSHDVCRNRLSHPILRSFQRFLTSGWGVTQPGIESDRSCKGGISDKPANPCSVHIVSSPVARKGSVTVPDILSMAITLASCSHH